MNKKIGGLNMLKTTESKGNEITKEQARWMYEKMLEI
ncbi:pyruvate dehydrogenase (acetyl-transferring) E1 component subunit alpha, partial [Bacillus wiedmannii]